MDAFELLKADHEKVAELFDRLETASGEAKIGVFNQIKSELELHTHIEEKIFYPVLERPKETHDLTLEAYEEHKGVKTLLAELSGSQSADDEWQAKAKVLRENVEHHVEEEEGELFDKAADALTDEEIEELGRRMEAEKARQTGSPEPAAKTSTQEKGIVSRIKEFVGLGSEPTRKKSLTAKRSGKKRASTASKKAGKKATKKAGKKATKKAGKKATKKAGKKVGKKAGKKAGKKVGKKAGKKAQAATTAKRAAKKSRTSGSSRSTKTSTKRARSK
jgi:hypothetical protein